VDKWKVELGSGTITFKAKTGVQMKIILDFILAVDVEGKVGIKASDLLNPKDNFYECY
jgi:hypothetical protein